MTSPPPRPDALVLTPGGLRFRGRRYPCTVGRGGLRATKREGDGATPVGHHRIVGMFYRPDRMARPAGWARPVGPRDLWCDDPDCPDYNRHVRAPHDGSFEMLRRADPLYDLVLVTDWNWPVATPRAGSCIFVHSWRRPGYPTAGCIALPRRHLLAIAAAIAPGARLVVRPGAWRGSMN
jgi:L,D-peptidoglycan transpeptidase YkuD (ErfK/YbiS/YcfS/YnhG family)